MASIIGVETLQHTNGTTAAEIKSDGTLYPTGHVVKVINDNLDTVFSTSSTTFVDTGLSVTITPSSTDSDILLTANLGLVGMDASSGIQFRLLRDSTVVGGSSSSNVFMHCFFNNTYFFGGISNSFLDSPSSTSSITYKLQAKSTGGTTVYINRRHVDANVITSSSFTAMEIAG